MNLKYFYQLCHQMFSTTYKLGYFIAYGTSKEFFMQHVTYEENIWKPILLKVTGFFEDVMIPEIVFSRVKFGLSRTKL